MNSPISNFNLCIRKERVTAAPYGKTIELGIKYSVYDLDTKRMVKVLDMDIERMDACTIYVQWLGTHLLHDLTDRWDITGRVFPTFIEALEYWLTNRRNDY